MGPATLSSVTAETFPEIFSNDSNQKNLSSKETFSDFFEGGGGEATSSDLNNESLSQEWFEFSPIPPTLPSDTSTPFNDTNVDYNDAINTDVSIDTNNGDISSSDVTYDVSDSDVNDSDVYDYSDTSTTTLGPETEMLPTPQKQVQGRNYVAYIPVPINDGEEEGDEEGESDGDGDDEYEDDGEEEEYEEDEEEEEYEEKPKKKKKNKT